MMYLIRTVQKRGMPVTRIFLLAALFLGGVVFVNAQTQSGGAASNSPQQLSPQMAVDMAIKNNLNLEMARIGTDIKKRKYNYAWNQFLPTVGVNGSLSRDNWATNATGVQAVGTPDPQGVYSSVVPYSVYLPQWHVNGAFSATLNLSIALFEGIRSLNLDYQAGLVTYDKARFQIEQAVRKMYNNILLLQANAALLQENYNNTQRQADMAEANYKAGLAPKLAWLQAQVAVENLKPAINDLDNSLSNLKGNFALLLGLSYNAPFDLEPLTSKIPYIPQDVADLISKAASGKPDIMELQANIMTLLSQRKAMRTQAFTPYFGLGWSVSALYNPQLDPFKNSWLNDSNWNNGGNFYFSLGLNFNSFFGFTKEGQQLKDMDASIQMQNIQLAQMIRDTELEIFTTVNSLEMIRTTAEASQAAVDLADQSYKLTEEAYKAGLQDFLSVQSSALALEQAKLQLETQHFNYLNGLIDLEYSTGVPFGTLSSAAIQSTNGGTK